MPNITVQELIDRAMAAADMHDDFVTEAQWFRWATVENRSLAVKVAQLGYVLVEDSVDITIDGSAEYDVDEPLAVLGVYEIMSNNMLRRVRAVNPFEGHRQTSNVITGHASEYYVRRDPQPPAPSTTAVVKVSLFPNPTSGTYRVYFIPHPTTFESVQDSVDYPLGWEERIVLGMARRALAKEESDTSGVSQQISETDSDIEAAVWGRLLGDAPTIRNVDQVERGWLSPYPYPWPPVAEWHFI